MRCGYAGQIPDEQAFAGRCGQRQTAVAAGVIYVAVKNGYQCAFMAPTEILANQHFETLSKMLEPAGITVRLITGSTSAAEKRRIKAELAAGEVQLAIGTHALIQRMWILKISVL